MKTTNNKKVSNVSPMKLQARRVITLQNFAMASVPCIIIGVLSFFKIATIPIYGVILGIFSQPVLMFILTRFRINHSEDGELVKKWQKELKEKASRRKSKNQKLKTELQEKFYPIKSIIPKSDKACSFKLFFGNELFKKAMPIITINGIKVTLEYVDAHEGVCYADKAITADIKKLTFVSGEFNYVIDNPYYLLEQVNLEDIRWQNEGCPEEKLIYIKSYVFPFCNYFSIYVFDLFVGGKIFGTYSGKYIRDKKAVVLNIADISKDKCKGKDCYLRPAFDIRRKIALPEPIKITVNKCPVVQL